MTTTYFGRNRAGLEKLEYAISETEFPENNLAVIGAGRSSSQILGIIGKLNDRYQITKDDSLQWTNRWDWEDDYSWEPIEVIAMQRRLSKPGKTMIIDKDNSVLQLVQGQKRILIDDYPSNEEDSIGKMDYAMKVLDAFGGNHTDPSQTSAVNELLQELGISHRVNVLTMLDLPEGLDIRVVRDSIAIASAISKDKYQAMVMLNLVPGVSLEQQPHVAKTLADKLTDGGFILTGFSFHLYDVGLELYDSFEVHASRQYLLRKV
jgi:hypothetical protein